MCVEAVLAHAKMKTRQSNALRAVAGESKSNWFGAMLRHMSDYSLVGHRSTELHLRSKPLERMEATRSFQECPRLIGYLENRRAATRVCLASLICMAGRSKHFHWVIVIVDSFCQCVHVAVIWRVAAVPVWGLKWCCFCRHFCSSVLSCLFHSAGDSSWFQYLTPHGSVWWTSYLRFFAKVG